MVGNESVSVLRVSLHQCAISADAQDLSAAPQRAHATGRVSMRNACGLWEALGGAGPALIRPTPTHQRHTCEGRFHHPVLVPVASLRPVSSAATDDAPASDTPQCPTRAALHGQRAPARGMVCVHGHGTLLRLRSHAPQSISAHRLCMRIGHDDRNTDHSVQITCTPAPNVGRVRGQEWRPPRVPVRYSPRRWCRSQGC